MDIISGDAPNQFLCMHPQTKMMIGLIQLRGEHHGLEDWRIELFMKVQGSASTKGEAVAFVRGAWAAVEAFNIFKKPERLQDVETRMSPTLGKPVIRK